MQSPLPRVDQHNGYLCESESPVAKRQMLFRHAAFCSHSTPSSSSDVNDTTPQKDQPTQLPISSRTPVPNKKLPKHDSSSLSEQEKLLKPFTSVVNFRNTSQSTQSSSTPATPLNRKKSLGASPRPILAESNRKILEQGGTPLKTHSSLARSIHQASPAPSRFLVGASPNGLRMQAGNSPRAKFVTPFKNGKRPSPRKPLTEISVNQAHQPSTKRKKSNNPLPSFECSYKGSRISLKEYGMIPGVHTIKDLVERELPDEVIFFNLQTASKCQYGNDIFTNEMFDTLKGIGCRFIDRKWVLNHTHLILWKLSGYCSCKPEEWRNWWNKERIVMELKYRYEREINNAHRSAIKQIQEHDMSPSVTLILCVSNIFFQETEQDIFNPEAQTIFKQKITGMEVTDGWYRAQCNIDEPLKRALKKGKIKIGSKIAVNSARLDSTGSEGTEVLEAYNKSKLILSGNSTLPAAWDAKLGHCKMPILVTLGSLNPDGGFVPLLDLIVKKSYPIAFVAVRDAEVSVQEEVGPWNEAEEAIKQDQWKKRLASIQEKVFNEYMATVENLARLTDELDTLASSKGVHGDFMSSQDVWDDLSPNDVCDTYEEMPSNGRLPALRMLDGKLLREAARVSRERWSEAAEHATSEIEQEIIKNCPPRKVRSMRIYRVEDYCTVRPASRDAQLTVWDAAEQRDNVLVAGQRYIISGLMPTKIKYWTDLKTEKKQQLAGSDNKPGEIFLQTSSRTRWIQVPAEK